MYIAHEMDILKCILTPKIDILPPKMYILARQMYILAPKMDKSLPFEKVLPQ